MEQVEDEWDRDPEVIDLEELLFVTYDSSVIQQEQILEAIKEQGFDPVVR